MFFSQNGSCLSHCFPHSHPYTLRAVAVSKSTAKYHMGQTPTPPPPPSTILPSHPPCPPGCLSSGLCGINELIHTALSGSIPFAARAQCKQASGSWFIGHSSNECARIRTTSKVLIPGYMMRSVWFKNTSALSVHLIAVETSGHLPEALDLNRSLAVGVLSRQKRFSRSNKREKKSLETQMLVKKNSTRLNQNGVIFECNALFIHFKYRLDFGEITFTLDELTWAEFQDKQRTAARDLEHF